MDLTGDPYDSDNAPQTDFEKTAGKKLTAETPYMDQIVRQDGKRYLEALTYVPVVMDKCVLCHENYADSKPGVAVGALSYRFPIQ